MPVTLDTCPAYDDTWGLILMGLILPEKRVYTALDLKDAFF